MRLARAWARSRSTFSLGVSCVPWPGDGCDGCEDLTFRPDHFDDEAGEDIEDFE